MTVSFLELANVNRVESHSPLTTLSVEICRLLLVLKDVYIEILFCLLTFPSSVAEVMVIRANTIAYRARILHLAMANAQ